MEEISERPSGSAASIEEPNGTEDSKQSEAEPKAHLDMTEDSQQVESLVVEGIVLNGTVKFRVHQVRYGRRRRVIVILRRIRWVSPEKFCTTDCVITKVCHYYRGGAATTATTTAALQLTEQLSTVQENFLRMTLSLASTTLTTFW